MKDPAVFLHTDYGCPPFAWRKYSKRTPSGDDIITYPAHLTLDLLPPKKRTAPKRKRAANNDTDDFSGDDFETSKLKADIKEESEVSLKSNRFSNMKLL